MSADKFIDGLILYCATRPVETVTITPDGPFRRGRGNSCRTFAVLRVSIHSSYTSRHEVEGRSWASVNRRADRLSWAIYRALPHVQVQGGQGAYLADTPYNPPTRKETTR